MRLGEGVGEEEDWAGEGVWRVEKELEEVRSRSLLFLTNRIWSFPLIFFIYQSENTPYKTRMPCTLLSYLTSVSARVCLG